MITEPFPLYERKSLRDHGCPTGNTGALVTLVRDADLTGAERRFTAALPGIPVP
jgi:hypothetical protein